MLSLLWMGHKFENMQQKQEGQLRSELCPILYIAKLVNLTRRNCFLVYGDAITIANPTNLPFGCNDLPLHFVQ